MSGEQANTQVLHVDGREIVVTSPDKVLWPQDGLTKTDLLDYYQAVAPVMLPYLRDHPVTLRVFPGGIDRPGHYRRDLPKDAPDWLPSATYSPASRAGELHPPLIPDAAALLWYAERGAIEFHMWLATADRLEQPDWAVFDLDPGDEVDFPAVLEAALLVRDTLAAQGIDGYPKTSGGRGLHVFVPLEPVHDFAAVRDWVRGIAAQLAEEHPDQIATAARGTHEGQRVTVDHAQNSVARNTAAPYTARGHPGAPVSAPVTWDEVAAGTIRPDQFTLRTMPERIQQLGDLWAAALTAPQRLPG